MQKPLSGQKAAILIANGFQENEMATFQRGLLEAGAFPRIVSTENGLAHGWQGNGWGHYFAVDCPLTNALAADYDILIIPSGIKSHEKLKLSGHTKRFIGGFVAAGKPIVAVGDAVHLLNQTGHISGYAVTGPEAYKDETIAAGGEWSEQSIVQCENLITHNVQQESALGDVLAALVNFITSREVLEEAA